MTSPPTFEELVSLIERRTAVLRAAASLADSGELPVRQRPGRTLRDLMFHLGTVQRDWAEMIPDWQVPRRIRAAEAENEGGLYEWLQRSTFLLTHALRTVGPDVVTLTRWAPGGPPMTARHIARRQLQESTIHAYDAQLGIGRPEPVPDEIAINGIDEFLRARLAAKGPWPYSPAQIEVRVSMTPAATVAGPLRREPPMRWLLSLGPAGAEVIPVGEGRPIGTLTGRAGDVLLALYGRTPMLAADTAGDARPIIRLLGWADTSCSLAF